MSEQTWPVSVKGVVLAAGHVLLLANERDEWELPGGRLEGGEPPEQCLAREVQEETGLAIEVDRITDSWVYQVLPQRAVLIVTYGCTPLAEVPDVVVSHEHREVRFVPLGDVGSYPMPDGYRRSIASVAEAIGHKASLADNR